LACGDLLLAALRTAVALTNGLIGQTEKLEEIVPAIFCEYPESSYDSTLQGLAIEGIQVM